MQIESILEIMESTANMLRGMTLDPSIPKHAKDAMLCKIPELEAAVVLADATICDACNKPITTGQRNVGHECDLHEDCVGSCNGNCPLDFEELCAKDPN